MSICLEYKKLKRTGFLPAFFGGGLLSAFVPIGNMMFRSEIFVNSPEPALKILFNANWQMMAMLNLFLIVIGACIMYHTEYANNAMQKMDALPIRQSSNFFSKFFILTVSIIAVLAIEAASLAFCIHHWFSLYDEFAIELLKSIGYAAILAVPTLILMTGIASICKNMWISLGVGIICMFVATMIPKTNFILSLFPFALPFQTLWDTESTRIFQFICGVGIETGVFGMAELIYLKVRRKFQ